MKIHRSHKHQNGAALVMTLGIMLIMVIVLLIAGQYTIKSMRTVEDQSATLEAQYVSESGLAWSKAYALQMKARFSGLQPTRKNVNDFLALVSGVCGSGQNTTLSSGCNLPTTEPQLTYAKQAISEFFRTWEGAPSSDTFWSNIFNDVEHQLNLGNGQQYTVYNVYSSNGTVTRQPLFSVTRLEWDFAPTTIQLTNGSTRTVNLMDAFRFCYDVGYYVSRGVTSDNGNRVVGQFPTSSTASTSSKCPTATSAGGGVANATDPRRNFIEVDAVGTQQDTTSNTIIKPPTTGIDFNNIAGAVGIEKIAQTTTSVTYQMCGQTSNGNSGACGNDRMYQVTYNFAANPPSVRCVQSSSGTNISVNLTDRNTLYKCQVRSQSNSASNNDFVYFLRDSNDDLVLILGGKTNGNNTIAEWNLVSGNLDLLSADNSDRFNKLYFVGDCLDSSSGGGRNRGNSQTGIPISSNFCEEVTSANLYAELDNDLPDVVVPGQTTTITNYEFKPLSTNADLIFKGRWIQLTQGDL